MTQSLLAFEPPESLSLVEKLARHFTARPNTWLDGMELAKVAGSYAWRSRCSDLRKQPYSLTIENRQRMVTGLTGKRYKVSEYRLAIESNTT